MKQVQNMLYNMLLANIFWIIDIFLMLFEVKKVLVVGILNQPETESKIVTI